MQVRPPPIILIIRAKYLCNLYGRCRWNQVYGFPYSDFGETEETTESSFDNEICYTGAVYDAASGLYYMNARYYDPANGRFISQDTYRGSIDNPGQWHLYAYCANDPINYVDPSGHVWETIIDVANIGWSCKKFLSSPSWLSAGYLVWDVGAAFIPFIPGSYVKSAIKGSGKLKDLTIKVPTQISELRKGKYLITGSYKSLNKMLKNQKKGRMEVHHLIEKRFYRNFKNSTDRYVCVVLDKDLHQKITKRWSNCAPHGKTKYSSLKKSEIREFVQEVYYDMPELKKLALKQIDGYGKNAKHNK